MMRFSEASYLLLLAGFCPLLCVAQFSPVGHSPGRSGNIRQSQSSSAQVVVTVDGNVNPELIPDEVAYFHFFRMLASHPTANPASEERRRSGYLRYYFRIDCGPKRDQDRSLSESQIQGVLAVADGVWKSIAAIDVGLKASADSSTIAAVEQQREEIVNAAISSLSTSVDPDAAAKIRIHIMEHVKRRIKLLSIKMPTVGQGN